MRYFRYYPWGLQLLLFLMMVLALAGFGTYLGLVLVPKLTSFDFVRLAEINENSPASMVRAAILVQGALSLFIFMLPALLFAYLTHPQPGKYLGLRPPGKWIQLLLVVFIMLGATPVLQIIEGWISHIDFGPGVKASQEKSDAITSAFLNMPDFAAFVRVFIVIAIVPAIGEELFFRGVLLRFAKQKSRTMALPVVFTAAVFAYSHTNIYGLVSIFMAGILLAVIYNLTGSLWCSIVGHLFFNGLQVVLAYLANSNAIVKAAITSNAVPYPLVVAGAIVFAVSFYLLLKNKTPPPPNWSDNFTRAELSEQVF